ncbi:MAG: hypothetical protein ACYTGQ_04350 [Planctomycetota bacterium]
MTETEDQVTIESSTLEAAIRKRGYVSGVYRQTFLDKKTGFRDPGMGLDIADFILEPGSDRAYRDRLDERMIYYFGDDERRGRVYGDVHGQRAKRKLEGPQICTQAKEMAPRVIRGEDFVGIEQSHVYTLAAPGHATGSTWSQRIVFPAGKRYFVSSQRIDSVNNSEAMFFRVDMPGHIKHDGGDTFSEVYLSYEGRVPASAFDEDFAPDERFNYRRDTNEQPKRMIRAVRLRDPETGERGPWLAGMVLEPSVVHEAWCHERGYICMILEFGGRPIQAGESFEAAFIVGYFDSLDEMRAVYDRYAGHRGLEVSQDGWELVE